ncbi:recombinase family protein [Bradyrhizobium sp. CCBAU 21362]|uniref:recombinase family protein n=1 Tax=Bradyrhizobium sp. CCBAU 21362 TaxID=1325082 RepID=UPI0023067474|nr:recombinase family protein [Bradyrhizobium sp. CCBAU 21362]
MSKITHEHLARQAVVYIRQSTADQVINNRESQRRQYGLADRARQLGWSEVVVIDDDLGRSGGAPRVPGSRRCSLPSAKGELALWSRLRPLGWPATAGIGIRSWSSAGSLEH